MRLMGDDDDHSEESPVNPIEQDSIPIRVNSVVRLTTMFDNHRIGKVIAFDPKTNLVTLHIRGSKANSTTVAMINLNHCREWTIEQECEDERIDPLYPIDLNKLRKRQMENEMEKEREISLINLKATRMGQALFRDLRRTMNQAIQWSNNDILINNTVRIVEPYHVENVSIDSLNCPKMKTSPKSDNDTKTHLIKLVDKFWSDPSKIVFNDSSTQIQCDSPKTTTTTTTEATDSLSIPSTTG